MAGPPADPFTPTAFFSALEESWRVGREKAAAGRRAYLTASTHGTYDRSARRSTRKSHSQGEYIFRPQLGPMPIKRRPGATYPSCDRRALSPRHGRRLLTPPGQEAQGMAASFRAPCKIASDNELFFAPRHLLATSKPRAMAGEEMGLLRRTTQQYHWEKPLVTPHFDAFPRRSVQPQAQDHPQGTRSAARAFVPQRRGS